VLGKHLTFLDRANGACPEWVDLLVELEFNKLWDVTRGRLEALLLEICVPV